MQRRKRTLKRNKRQVVLNQYNRASYLTGKRISKVQVAHRVGYLDAKTGHLFPDEELDYDAWVWTVNKVRETIQMTPQKAAMYVNNIYKNHLHTKYDYSGHVELLKNTCGKWFSVVPTMRTV